MRVKRCVQIMHVILVQCPVVVTADSGTCALSDVASEVGRAADGY